MNSLTNLTMQKCKIKTADAVKIATAVNGLDEIKELDMAGATFASREESRRQVRPPAAAAAASLACVASLACLRRWHACAAGMLAPLACLRRWHACAVGMLCVVASSHHATPRAFAQPSHPPCPGRGPRLPLVVDRFSTRARARWPLV